MGFVVAARAPTLGGSVAPPIESPPSMTLPPCILRLADGHPVAELDPARDAHGALALIPRLLPDVLVGADTPFAGLVGWSAVKAIQAGSELRVWTPERVRRLTLRRDGERWSWWHAGSALGDLSEVGVRCALGEDVWEALERLPPVPVARVALYSPVR